MRTAVVLVGTPDQVSKIRQDRFNVSYEKDGKRLDEALGTGNLLEDFLKNARLLLHRLTHSGMAQLGMRFDGSAIGASVSEAQILMLVNSSSNAAFLVTILVAKHYNINDVAQTANDAYLEYGKTNLLATPHLAL